MSSLSNTMNERHQEIQVWLENVFGGESVPSYELNKTTIHVLYNLMKKNRSMDEDTQLVIADLRQKTQEYNAEAGRLERVLKGVSITSSVLSQSGIMSVRNLANVALLLQIKDISDTNYMLALQALQDELYKTEEIYCQEQTILQDLRDKTKTALQKYNTIKRSLAMLQQEAKSQQPQMEGKAKETVFSRSKAKEYKEKISQLQKVLSSTGVDSSIYHRELVHKSEELQKLKDQMAPLKAKLQTYHSLPPDISLTKVKLEELKREVDMLESEVCKNIDLMHM
ncbi:HAUS augmin-like complex subunit 1 [Ylistrum balloti]|uniref:HAUS augmin-like complex subunit 1 n=1 Tax=Ylistrum balloti TaxID=509963 RepID=UPI002905E2E2|nr:HAUS augmin-like complex subunit 1 [Ylistrum balloti]